MSRCPHAAVHPAVVLLTAMVYGTLLVWIAPMMAAAGSKPHLLESRAFDVDAPLAPTTTLAGLRVSVGRVEPRSVVSWQLSTPRISVGRAAKAVRPAVSDTRLGRALADDYRGGPNPIGDGSALDAARHTVTTGELVGGSTHLEKVVEMRDRYARILRRGGLGSADEAVARSRYDAYRNFAREHDLDAMMKARGLR